MSRLIRRSVAAGGLVAAALPLTLTAATAAPEPGGRHPHPSHRGRSVPVQILAVNDVHGALEAPTGSGGKVTGADGSSTDAGGAEYLATHLKTARARAKGASWTVSAGDNIGGSPFLSQAFYDEPTIQALNLMRVTASAVGNHELDHGWLELHRMAAGGCLVKDPATVKQSCALGPYRGANFDYLAANIHDSAGKNLAPYTIRTYRGVKVAFIGLTLKSAPQIVSASGITTLTFEDEVAAGNRTAAMLRRKGVRAMVALVHQGGQSPTAAWDYRCGDGSTISGDIVPIARGLSADIDAVVSSHSHQAYVCDIPDPSGRPRLVTQAGNNGRLYTELGGVVDRRRKDFDRRTMTATNHVVTRDVAKDPRISALINAYTKRVGPVAAAKVGQVTADVTADRNAGGSTALGNLIADAQLVDPSAAGGGKAPQIAFMNPGGIRADLTYAPTAGEGAGVVTYQEAFSVQPFGNYVTSMDLTGAQIYALLGQQWSGSYPKVLQVSKGFTYEYTLDAAGKGSVVPGSVRLGGVPVEAGTTYRVVANSFLAAGGDGFTTFAQGTNPFQGGLDIDALTRYLGANSPYAPVTEQRIVKR